MENIEYKCPCCGYTTTKYNNDWEISDEDEKFIRIKSVLSNGYVNDNGDKVILMGCPKCQAVSFQVFN